MFIIFMHLYLHVESGSPLRMKTRHDSVHVYRNMQTSVGVLEHVPMHTEGNKHAPYAR